MKIVPIFIAGATDLQAQRMLLKSVANDLNVEFMSLGVQVLMYSHEILQDNQQAYNKFITEDSDYVFFIIDGEVGNKTLQEFNLAIRTLDREGRPKILVFSHLVKNLSEDVVRMEGILEAATDGDYFVQYHDDADLCRKAEKRLRHILNKKLEQPAAGDRLSPQTRARTSSRTDATKSTRRKPWYRKPAVGAAVLAAVIITALLSLRYIHPHPDTEDSEQTLIIAGGASALKHIAGKYGFHPDDHPNYYYMHMPSGVAWQLLTEEVISNTYSSKQRYTPVCVSATAATDSSFLSNMITVAKFTRKASVISFDMGMDPLVVYVDTNAYTKTLLAPEIVSGQISARRLADIIGRHRDSINIMPTSPRSGTRTEYQRQLEKYGADLSFARIIFSEISDAAHLSRNGIPYMVLGSAAYYPHVFENESYGHKPVALALVDDSNRSVGKPIRLYCLAYTGSEENELLFPEATKKLLRELHLDTIPNLSGILDDATFMRDNPNKVVLGTSELYRKHKP